MPLQMTNLPMKSHWFWETNVCPIVCHPTITTSVFCQCVFDNTACDLDSQVSALLWAYYMQTTNGDESKLFIPMFNIPAKELKLRKDAVHLFQSIDKSLIDNLFFIDSVPLDQLVSLTSNGGDDEEKGNENASFKLKVHLMDHNKLSLSLDPILGPFVCFIIDHHKDEGQYLEQCGPNRHIAVCGSNVSLIMDYILSASADTDYDALSSLGPVFGALVNAVILLDTGAFSENLKKTTETDTKIFKLLEAFNVNKDYRAWYDSLLALRTDSDGFGFADLLVKDLKIFKEGNTVFGIPGLGTSIQDIAATEQDTLFETIRAFQIEKRLGIVPAMTIFEDKADHSLQRQLALFSDDHSLFKDVSTALQTQQNLAVLKLQPMDIQKWKHQGQHMLKATNQPFYYQWWKMDVSISRKKLVPLLRQILKSKL